MPRFPRSVIEDLGYNVAVHGQKGFNGVAILSKRPFSDVRVRLPGDPSDEQARYLEAVVPAESGVVRVAAIYLPNGNPPETEKYHNKLRWMDRLIAHARELLAYEEPLVLAGDYNVIPRPIDAKISVELDQRRAVPAARPGRGMAPFSVSGSSMRCAPPRSKEDIFTFWDYQAGSWQKDNGIRIDHILLSPQAADRLRATRIDKHLRAWERPRTTCRLSPTFSCSMRSRISRRIRSFGSNQVWARARHPAAAGRETSPTTAAPAFQLQDADPSPASPAIQL